MLRFTASSHIPYNVYTSFSIKVKQDWDLLFSGTGSIAKFTDAISNNKEIH